ncbi:type II secretion system secretin GspD [Ramlibacter sp. PS4R-6]|uniref:type II secretion system secretin GspD n=1 Tax=Ramlibacter sp. PS4R-6 TaxID=3133438 RepID=UPI00309C5FDF
MNRPTRSLASLALALAVVAAAPVLAQQSRTRTAAREPVTLNFVNADIEAVARTMAAITGRNIVVDPRVKGTLTLSTDKPVPPQAAYNQFLAALRLSGFTVVDSGGILKLVPEADAKLQGGAVNAGAAPAGGQIVTQIFRLNFEPAGNLVPILRPLISPNNTINVDPSTNSLVITDYADNLQRIGRIIASLDVSNATDVDVIPLQHQVAADIAPVVQRLIDASGASTTPGAPAAGVAAAGDASFRTTIIAETRSNALLVRAANPARLHLVRSIVQKLDQPSGKGDTGNIWVVYLKNAEATRLAVTLRAAMAAMTPAGTGATGGGAATPISAGASTGATSTAGGASPATAPTQPAAQVQTGGQIQADPATNALIITAPEPQYRQIRAVIDRLDTRRAQVYIEGLVAEVNNNKIAQFGIQWQLPLNSTDKQTIGILGTNFSVGTTPNIVSLATQNGTLGSVLPGNGVNIGTVSKIAGHFVLSSIANFLQSTGDGNVLSTPNLLTLDNEEAKIVVGQNVPFVTGQFTNTGSTNGSVNPFQTIERKDVGLTLRVRPQISDNGTVKLQIFQEVSSVDESSRNAVSGLITNKSSIESNVLVEDGSIVVLGGLLKDSYSDSDQKIPGLGDLPLVGNLFKSTQRTRSKSNLMVFLRPVVLRDGERTEMLSLDRYELMRGKQTDAQPTPSIVTPVNEGPVMPPGVGPVAVPPQPPGQPIRVVPAPLGR